MYIYAKSVIIITTLAVKVLITRAKVLRHSGRRAIHKSDPVGHELPFFDRLRDCASARLGLGLMIDTQAVTARAKSHCQCLGA